MAEKRYNLEVTLRNARARSKRLRELGGGAVNVNQSSVSIQEGDKLPLEVVNVGTEEAPEWALKSRLPFYSEGWMSAYGSHEEDAHGGGATSLAELEDVDVEEAQNGDILQYDGEHWTAQTLPAVNTDKHYTHRQDVASDVWTIDHGLGKFPAVTVVDSCGNVVVGDVTYTSLNQLTVTFNAVFSGKAYLN